MARSHDGYYDPPEEPEYTPAEELALWVDKLLDYRKRAGAMNFQLEKCDDFLNNLRRIRDEQTADELPDYDDPIDAGVPVAAQQAEYEALVSSDEEASNGTF